MLTLTLFRHAKAERDEAFANDADRPLAPRGRRDAMAIADWLLAKRLAPDLVLCSTAVRTRETAAIALAGIGDAAQVRFESVLYLATPRTILGVMQRCPAESRHVMVVGHNPGLHMLAMDLMDVDLASNNRSPNNGRARHDALAAKLPTGAVVVLTFNVSAWAELGARTGRLVHFVTPRGLAEAGAG